LQRAVKTEQCNLAQQPITIWYYLFYITGLPRYTG